MSIADDKLQPWQVFRAARKYLGAATVARIFGREVRSAYSWAQDPVYTEHRCRCPLELLHALFERMDAVGLGYAARAGISYLQTALDDADEPGPVVEPLATITEEVLADYRAVAALQQAVERCADLELVGDLRRQAVDEIERTYARYLQDCTRGHQ